ncbi:MAG: hypothetical protein ACJAU3_001233, partial [Zhongshania sp.]
MKVLRVIPLSSLQAILRFLKIGLRIRGSEMSDVTSPRAKLVEMLWQLKKTYDKQGDKGVRYVHFNTLLNDPAYRKELIEQAAVSTNPDIRELG